MSKTFWQFVKNEAKESELILEGVIASESWYDDEVSPKQFREELDKHTGNITVRINSPGGDVFAGVSIMNMLKDREGDVTIIVDGIAASIASVIAMAGDKVIMNTGSMMMIHNAWSMAVGDSQELRKVADTLDKIGESIMDVYATRTGLTTEQLKTMLNEETWMTAEEAVELGFADEAVEGKTKLSNLVKNLMNLNQEVNNAVAAPAMSIRTKLKNEQEVEEQDVTDTTEEPAEVVTEESETQDAVETEEETEESEETEVEETEVEEVTETPTEEIKDTVEKETKMSTTTDIAKDQVLEPSAQAPVASAPVMTVKDYLNTSESMEDFARILEANAAASLEDTDASDRVRAAWKSHIETKMGVTNPQIFLPTPLIQEIEDAFKAGGEIWNRVSKTGLDAFNAAWDAEDDVNSNDGRGRGYNRASEEEKAEQVLTFANRILRPQFVYKYITLNREDVKEQRTTGALVRFVLSELPRRIIREVERAIIIGDGRASNDDYKIQEGNPRGFYPVKGDTTAGNVFASTYTPAGGESHYEALVRAMDLLEAEGRPTLIAKKGYLTDLKLEQSANGGYLFPLGTNFADVLGLDTIIEPDWLESDADNDAYLVVLPVYRTVGDSNIEAFTNFLLKTNKNEYLQEIWAGGGLTARKAAVAIASASS